MPSIRFARTLVIATALAAPARPARAQDPHAAHGAPPAVALRIPESMRVEHREIHDELTRATTASGAVGAAAPQLAAVLHPHFAREEQIALPPLALLAPLSRGEATAAMRAVLPLTDSLRAELPRMLREHAAIRAATVRMGEVARAHGDSAVARLAEKLALHARSEEELFYPAAVLVGDLVKARVPRP